MRIVIIILLGIFISVSTAFANGFPKKQPPTPAYDVVNAKKCAVPKKTPAPKKYKMAYIPVGYSITLYPGSLKHNLIRIGHNYGWDTVVWNAQEDYLWIGTTTITGDNLEKMLTRVLIKYPLQAQFYQGNRVLAIVPRNLP